MLITTRKLNKVRNSFYVYLPKQWCSNHNLTGNSEVRIQEGADGTLLISPTSTKPKERDYLRFQIDDVIKDQIENLLVGAYIVGVQGLNIGMSKPLDMATRERISHWIRKLPGFEILNEHEKSVTIRDTSEKQVVLPVLRRQFSTTKYMLGGLLRALETGKTEETSRIVSRDDDVDRHRYFVERLCHIALHNPAYARRISITPSDCLHFSLAAKYIERIADHVCGAINEVANVENVDTFLAKSGKALAKAYDEATHTFFSSEANRGDKRRTALTKASREAFEALISAKRMSVRLSKREASKKGYGPHEALILFHMERIASYCSDIGEVAINRIIEKRIHGPLLGK